jgi:hypothetical protein
VSKGTRMADGRMEGKTKTNRADDLIAQRLACDKGDEAFFKDVGFRRRHGVSRSGSYKRAAPAIRGGINHTVLKRADVSSLQ